MSRILFALSDIYNELTDLNFNVENEEELLDQIVDNRIVGMVYKNILKLKNNPISTDSLERLKQLYENNVLKAKKFKSNLTYLAKLLENANFDYALLKGSFLTSQLYEEGFRTSNDIDILINNNDIDKCQKLLLENGFIQGSYSKKKGLVPATRREIIMSRMNFGETIPLIKLIDNESFAIDINFSLDFKPPAENNTIGCMLNRVRTVSINNHSFKTLNIVDFLIHLCCHLYKEATTFDWVAHNRDLSLYKFSDINLFLHTYNDSGFMNQLAARINEFNVNKECYYTFYNSAIIYPDFYNIPGFNDLLKNIVPDSLDFMKQVVWPTENETLYYIMDFEDWFFCKNKARYLKKCKTGI